MRGNHTWYYVLDEKGYERLTGVAYQNALSQNKQFQKMEKFVNKALSQVVKEADCGWGGCLLTLWAAQDHIIPYVSIYTNEGELNRLVNVEADSLYGILNDVVDNLF